jgi:hypothetical protein
MYSVAVPQVLIACMLVWILVLVLGDGRPLWQIVLGSLLAGLMLMTRINMLPVLPLLLLYIFWQHGVKAGILSTICYTGTFALLARHIENMGKTIASGYYTIFRSVPLSHRNNRYLEPTNHFIEPPVKLPLQPAYPFRTFNWRINRMFTLAEKIKVEEF